MKRTTVSFVINNLKQFKQQMLQWADQFSICCLLDNHQYPSAYPGVEYLLAAGAVKTFEDAEGLSQLISFQKNNPDWLLGHVSYDFKNHFEPLSSQHFDGIEFPEIFFFQPETVLQLSGNRLEITTLAANPGTIYADILAQDISVVPHTPSLNIQPRITRQEYLRTIQQLKKHILYGDCYEINFCQEFFAQNATIDTINLYHRLTEASPVPFACYYKLNDKYLLCASPERYLKKTGTHIISQPIKGTVKRDLSNKIKDDFLKQQLSESRKEQSENVMIVDLVRNDLSKICKEGSVRVEELFGIYSFPQVHQMISTITGELRENIDFAELLKATFPMGSMTGAPKRKVMELTEQYEKTKRGLYSGCVGYLSPENDWDFNVVIRSIQYNNTNHYLSYQVGGGITFNSDAEKEYEECMLKATAIRKSLL